MTRTIGARLALVAMAAILLPVLGCASDGEKTDATLPVGEGGPKWIDQPQGVYEEGGEQWIYAVGQANFDPNRSAQRNKAAMRARTEMARVLKVAVQSMAEDYQSTNRDFYNMDAASSVEYYEEISRQVTDVTLSGSRQLDGWQDKATGDYYILYGMPLDTSFFDAYMKSAEDAYARYSQREMIKAQKEEYAGKLDEQLEKMKQMDDKQLAGFLKLNG
ncbi:MAG: LPP20 family lipoprotein [Planctomycetes bacterium]|nr:LPP20 family lipoprotein [Planctomycetota bacterium]